VFGLLTSPPVNSERSVTSSFRPPLSLVWDLIGERAAMSGGGGERCPLLAFGRSIVWFFLFPLAGPEPRLLTNFFFGPPPELFSFFAVFGGVP